MSLSLSINLIPKARQAKTHRHRRLKFWTGVWSCYGAALLVAVGIMYLRLGASTQDLSSQLQKEDEQLAAIQTDQQGASAELSRVSQKLASAKGLLAQPDWSELLSILADLRGNDIALAGVQLALDTEQAPADKKSGAKPVVEAQKTKWMLQTNGYGKTPESVSQFVLRLESTQLFDRVNLLKTNREGFQTGDATSFSIQCPIKGRGRALQ